tara:strand:- start:184 stop:1602 length:1419 start_codon:yes stop_codon:yes gene_type:complete
MLVIENFKQVTAQIESERGITSEDLISAVEQALVSAVRKKFPENALLEATLDPETGEANIFRLFNVVESPEDSDFELNIEQAKEMDKKAKIDTDIRINITPEDFGRIAAQTAKQVIIQRIREAEKNVIYDEFEKKKGHILTGTVQCIEGNTYIVNLGRIEAPLTYREQIPGEKFEAKEQIRVYISDVTKTTRGTQIHISRTNSGFLKRLFETEIPEIEDGIIEVMSVSREPGNRSKVAVKTNNPTIGAVGTCVGHMGGRIQSIIKELRFEKIDVLEWSDNPKVFISNSLKPAKIHQVFIKDEEEKTAVVVVPNDQMSLAIGKNGVNVRLSVQLTGWKMDIITEDEFETKGKELLGEVGLLDKLKQDAETGSQGTLTIAEEDEEEISLESSSLLQNIAKSKQEEEDDDTSDSNELKDESDTDIAVTMKVSDLAKELNLKTKELIEKSAEFGVEIKSNRAVLNVDDINTIREKI